MSPCDWRLRLHMIPVLLAGARFPADLQLKASRGVAHAEG